MRHSVALVRIVASKIIDQLDSIRVNNMLIISIVNPVPEARKQTRIHRKITDSASDLQRHAEAVFDFIQNKGRLLD